MKSYTNFKKIFLVRVFWLKYIFRIKFKIPILMLLPKNSVPFEGLYSSKLGLMCLVQGHKAVTPVRLEPAAPRSRVKHSNQPAQQQRLARILKLCLLQIWI